MFGGTSSGLETRPRQGDHAWFAVASSFSGIALSIAPKLMTANWHSGQSWDLLLTAVILGRWPLRSRSRHSSWPFAMSEATC